jgi:hypothetical protein
VTPPELGQGARALLSIAPIAIIAVAVVGFAVAIQVSVVRNAVTFSLRMMAAAILWAVGVCSYPIWWFVKPISDRLFNLLGLEALGETLLGMAAGKADPLRQGDRRAVAERLWPPALFPDLYEAVPDDLRRPIYEDGRLVGGVGVHWLADRHLTRSAYGSAVRGGFNAGATALILMIIFLALDLLIGVLGFGKALFGGARPVIESWPDAEPVRVSVLSVMGANFVDQLPHLLGKFADLLIYIPAAAVLSAGIGVLTGLLLISTWMRAKTEPYQVVTKDADVRWPFRIETRENLRETYRRQIAQAIGHLRDAATFRVGVATGTLRTRGDLSAPMRDQEVRLDQESLFQHVLVFGGTGEGKTTAVLKPLLRQILSNPAFGAFIADAKGVLWQDAETVAKGLGRASDVIVIGTGPDQKGIDPIANLTPTQVAATLRSVLQQIGGAGGGVKDSFWPEMAANILRHMLTLGFTYARTAAGKAEFERTGVNPYSLWWAYQAVISPQVAKDAIAELRADQTAREDAIRGAAAKNAASDVQRLILENKAMFTQDLHASMEYVEGAWKTMANETRTGIIASTTQLMDGFSGAPILRERFASGRPGELDLRAALDGKILLNALSSIEDGLPARLTSILIKTALYREARVREAEMKRSGMGKPQDKPCLVMMDEVQELATVDPASGLSDASFWNVARSTGLAGVFATQTLSALTQAMGKEASDNFVQQSRSKIFLRVEEMSTVEYACWCAGEYERNRVYEEGQRESLEARAWIDGWSPLAPINETETVPIGPRSLIKAAAALLFPRGLALEQASPRPTYDVDRRFIATDALPGEGGGMAGNSARMGSSQAAHWRSEDLNRQYLSQGNELQPALTVSDIMHMGRWHAFAQIQRAGAVRQDLIRLEHDFT